VAGDAVVRSLGDPTALLPATLAGLSPHFEPFLPYFVRETFRSGGGVDLIASGPRVEGLSLGSDVEQGGSVFARTDRAVELLRAHRPRWALFAERQVAPVVEPFLVYTGPPPIPAAGDRPRYAVRPVVRDDLPGVQGLLERTDGPVNPGWLSGLPSESERGFVAEHDGRVVGVGWVSLVGDRARLHSLTVEPRYRRLGIGGDLLRARLRLAGQLGVREVLSEIAEGNDPSRRLAETAGMRPSGRMYLHPALTPTPEGRRRPDTPSP
jgi:L-amino acid N-acyltransferase YncA